MLLQQQFAFHGTKPSLEVEVGFKLKDDIYLTAGKQTAQGPLLERSSTKTSEKMFSEAEKASEIRSDSRPVQ